MANLMARPAGTATRASLAGWLGWDPSRSFFGNYGGVGGVDIARTENGFSVEIPAPGFKPSEIDVTFENGVLTVAGKSEKRSFTRTLLLPDEIDSETIAANVENGMLTLTLSVHAKAQPKKIDVTSQS